MYLFILGLPKYDAYLPFVSPNSASLVINSGSWWQSKGVVTLTIPPLIRNPSNGYINPYFFGLMTIPYMEIMGFFGPEHIWIHLSWSLASNSATFSSSSWCLRDLNSGRTPKSRSTCCWFCQKKNEGKEVNHSPGSNSWNLWLSRQTSKFLLIYTVLIL